MSFFLQFLTKKLGIDTVIFGYLQTVSAIALLLGGPLFGRMGDLFGAKIVFLISFGGSFFFYFIMAIAGSALHLFVSQLFSFAMNAMQCMFQTQKLPCARPFNNKILDPLKLILLF